MRHSRGTRYLVALASTCLLLGGVGLQASTRADLNKDLWLAANAGDDAKVEALLKLGADPNVTRQDVTALMLAAANARPAMAAALVSAGAKVSAVDPRGRTALYFAAIKESPEIVKLLIAQGADVNQSTALGQTALLEAAAIGRSDIVRLLLNAGADPARAMRSSGLQALHLAVERGWRQAVPLLLDKGVDINAQTTVGDTPLLYAIARGRVDIARLLLERGANAAMANKDKWTAARLAAALKDTASMQLMADFERGGVSVIRTPAGSETPARRLPGLDVWQREPRQPYLVLKELHVDEPGQLADGVGDLSDVLVNGMIETQVMAEARKVDADAVLIHDARLHVRSETSTGMNVSGAILSGVIGGLTGVMVDTPPSRTKVTTTVTRRIELTLVRYRAPLPGGPAATEPEVTAWIAIEDANQRAGFEQYLERYPAGRFVEAAKARLEHLKARDERRQRPAIVYVFRYIGDFSKPSFFIDGVEVVRLPDLRWVKLEVPAGERAIVVGSKDNPLKYFDFGGGETYFLRSRYGTSSQPIELATEPQARLEFAAMRPLDPEWYRSKTVVAAQQTLPWPVAVKGK